MIILVEWLALIGLQIIIAVTVSFNPVIVNSIIDLFDDEDHSY